jgi:acyl carrier protein
VLRTFIVDNFLFGEESEASVLTDDDSLLELGIIDSTGILELVGFLEQHFGILVDDEELVPENLDTISRLAAFVDRKQQVAVR